MKKIGEHEIHIKQDHRYRLEVQFDKEAFASIALDEPPPLGEDSAPNASRILSAAIGSCLSASLVFCLGRHGVKVEHGIEAKVHTDIVRNEERRLRIGGIEVTLSVPPEVDPQTLEACRKIFEDFCTVTESVRSGIQVSVNVESRS
jgi:uncharacterized OsmC-like protein